MLICLVAALPSAAGAATPSERAERYLLRAQNADGGFGAAPGQASSPLYSGWTGLGLAAAGNNPRDVARRGRSLAAYTKRGVRGMRDVGEIERTVLLLRAAGLDPRSYAGRDLVAPIIARRRGNGSIAGYVSYTAFGVLALRAAGEPAGRATVRWLIGTQNEDGGFGVAPSSSSDSDMTGAVLQALAVTGRARSAAASRAVAFLRSSQGEGGGFGQMRGRSPNAQSTAYAVQGLVAVGAARGAVRRGISYLAGLQRTDGSIAYSASSAQTPVWVTAQALAALERAPLPLAAVPRERRPAGTAAEAPPPADATPAAPTAEPKAEPAPAGPAEKEDKAPAAPPATQTLPPQAEGDASPGDDGLTPDPAPNATRTSAGDDGGGVTLALVLGALAVVGGVLWFFRGRLRRLSPMRGR